MIRDLSRLPESSMLGLIKRSQVRIHIQIFHVFSIANFSRIFSLFFFLLSSSNCSFDVLLQRGSQGGNPAIVTLEGAAKDQLLSHDRSLGDDEGTAKGERRRMNAGGAIVVDSLGLG